MTVSSPLVMTVRWVRQARADLEAGSLRLAVYDLSVAAQYLGAAGERWSRWKGVDAHHALMRLRLVRGIFERLQTDVLDVVSGRVAVMAVRVPANAGLPS